MTVGLFIAGPWTGRLCDRYGAARVGALSLIGYALVAITMALTVNSLAGLWASYFVIALLGTGSTSIVLVRPVISAFRETRGFALGLALTGAGIAAFWVPIVTQAVIANRGWQAAYVVLAAAAILAAPLVWVAFRPFERTAGADAAAVVEEGLTILEARLTGRFWLLSGITLAMAAGVAGLVFHLVPLFLDQGATALEAARMASVVGLASTVGRLIIGVMLDRFPPGIVAGCVLSASAAGAILLWSTDLEFAWIAAALLGLAAGAEVDLIAFLTARYFGRRAYGAIYGWQYSVFALGYGFAPWFVGLSRDQFGDYRPAMLVSAVLVAAAAAGMFWLARRQGGGERYASIEAAKVAE